jgi:hypothetical protein
VRKNERARAPSLFLRRRTLTRADHSRLIAEGKEDGEYWTAQFAKLVEKVRRIHDVQCEYPPSAAAAITISPRLVVSMPPPQPLLSRGTTTVVRVVSTPLPLRLTAPEQSQAKTEATKATVASTVPVSVVPDVPAAKSREASKMVRRSDAKAAGIGSSDSSSSSYSSSSDECEDKGSKNEKIPPTSAPVNVPQASAVNTATARLKVTRAFSWHEGSSSEDEDEAAKPRQSTGLRQAITVEEETYSSSSSSSLSEPETS